MTETHEFDFIIVGSGGGAMCAALRAHERGLRVLMVEKDALVGGSTALSGGVLWVPANPAMERDGIVDNYEDGLKYFESVVGEVGRASSAARRRAFLTEGPNLIRFLEREGIHFLRQEERSDYYDELPGGSAHGRSIEVELFSINRLGEWASKLRLSPRSLPILGHEARHLFLANRTLKGKYYASLLGARMFLQRLTKRRRLGVGAALAGRLLEACIRRAIPIWTGSRVIELLEENGRISGILIERESGTKAVHARDGVLLASGGFSRSVEMRRKFQPQPNDATWTSSNPGDTGEMLTCAMKHGAATALLDQAIWLPTSLPPDSAPMIHVAELSKPFCMLVDSTGQRYVNEGGSYMATGTRMYARNAEVPAIPSWLILDARHRRYYPWGMTPPMITPQRWFDTGYFKKGQTIEELATLCGIDPAGLRANVNRFNEFARRGIDEDFRKGARHYDRYFGDPRVKPNPCLGPIERGPFLAVGMVPGDVGTIGGLVTDEFARVIHSDDSIIRGLYATGNVTAPVTGRVYPGAGASISASCVFGALAAQHAADVRDR